MTKVSSAALHLKMRVANDYYDYISLRAVRDTDECTGRKLCALLPQQHSLRRGILQKALSKLQHRSTHKYKYGCVYIVFHIEGFFYNILQLTIQNYQRDALNIIYSSNRPSILSVHILIFYNKKDPTRV